MGHLHSFCAINDIDTHEIDSEINFHENKSHLVSLTIPEPEYQIEFCEEIERVNAKLSWEEFAKREEEEIREEVNKWLKEQRKEKTPHEEYLQLNKEFGYVEPEPIEFDLLDYMIKSLVVRIQLEDGSWKTRVRKKINFLNGIV